MAYAYEIQTREWSGYDIKAEAYKHLGFALTISSITVFIMLSLGIDTILPLYWIGSGGEFIIIIILFFGILFGSGFSESTATILLYAFAVCSSITLSLIVYIALALDPAIVVGAVGTTTVVTFLAYLFSGQIYKRINQISKIAVVLVIGFFIFALIGFFTLSANPVFYLIIS